MKQIIEIKEVAPQKPAKETRGLKLNLEFSIKDYDATRAKHDSRIRTLGAKGVRYRDIIDVYTEDNIISEIVGSTQFNYFYKGLFEGGISKSNVRTLKTFVNYKTKEEIERNLEYNDLSKWYSTAFYTLFYSKVNQLMKRITKELLKYYVEA